MTALQFKKLKVGIIHLVHFEKNIDILIYLFLQATHSDVHCIVHIENTNIRVPARVEGSRFVICDEATVRFFAIYL